MSHFSYLFTNLTETPLAEDVLCFASSSSVSPSFCSIFRVKNPCGSLMVQRMFRDRRRRRLRKPFPVPLLRLFGRSTWLNAAGRTSTIQLGSAPKNEANAAESSLVCDFAELPIELHPTTTDVRRLFWTFFKFTYSKKITQQN